MINRITTYVIQIGSGPPTKMLEFYFIFFHEYLIVWLWIHHLASAYMTTSMQVGSMVCMFVVGIQ